jgi:hypothetical protein
VRLRVEDARIACRARMMQGAHRTSPQVVL